MTAMTFGVFDWLDQSGVPLGQQYDERLELAMAADEAGFHCYHLAEHHGTPLGMAPSPSVFLAAVARLTSRIRLGPLVYLLPLYEPLRLAEEVCMLDHLSQGRFELGIGRGASPIEAGFYNIDVAATKDIFFETLRTMVAAFTSPVLDVEGTRTPSYSSVPMEITPLQRPYPPLWYPTTSAESAAWAGAQGMHLMGLGPGARFRLIVDAYRTAWEEHAGDPSRLNAHVASPYIGMNRQIVVAETDSEAAEIGRRAFEHWAEGWQKLWRWAGHDTKKLDRTLDYDGAVAEKSVIVGSPEIVREQVEELADVAALNYLAPIFAWGSITHKEALRSLQLFADDVMPSFR